MLCAADVDDVVQTAGRTEQRNRASLARVMAYFSIGMDLYFEASYENVFTQLTDGLPWSPVFHPASRTRSHQR